MAVKLSLAAEFSIVDPALAVNSTQDFLAAFYLHMQLALREAVSALKADELMAQRQSLGLSLLESGQTKVTSLGLSVSAVNVKDLTFPGELKKIFAQVVKAQKEGLAALERARGETAALRNLANAARLVEGNPALLQLRLLQSLGDAGGNYGGAGPSSGRHNDPAPRAKRGRAGAPGAPPAASRPRELNRRHAHSCATWERSALCSRRGLPGRRRPASARQVRDCGIGSLVRVLVTMLVGVLITLGPDSAPAEAGEYAAAEPLFKAARKGAKGPALEALLEIEAAHGETPLRDRLTTIRERIEKELYYYLCTFE